MGILGFIVMVVMVVVGLIGSGSIAQIIDLPSVVIVIGATTGALLMSFGSGLGTAIKAVFRKTADRAMLTLGVAVFERGQSYAVASGVLGTLVGVVVLLSLIDKASSLGPGLATALITMAYGLFAAYGILAPVAASLRRRLAGMEG